VRLIEPVFVAGGLLVNPDLVPGNQVGMRPVVTEVAEVHVPVGPNPGALDQPHLDPAPGLEAFKIGRPAPLVF
jgi:hypothetical protein